MNIAFFQYHETAVNGCKKFVDELVRELIENSIYNVYVFTLGCPFLKKSLIMHYKSKQQ